MLSEIKFKDNDNYLYANGLIRSLENKLLTEGDYYQILDLDISNFFNILVEKGYRLHNSKENITFDKVADWERWHYYKLIRNLVKKEDELKIFYLQNDFNNIKLMLKYKIILEKLPELDDLPLINFTYYNNRDLYNLIFEGIKENIDEFVVNFINKIINMKEKPNSKIIEIFTDINYYKYMIYLSKKIKSDFLYNFFNLTAFLINIKNFLRIKLSNNNLEDFRSCFIEQNICKEEDFIEIWDQNVNVISQKFIKEDFYFSFNNMISQYAKDKDLSVLEKNIDDFLTMFLKENLQDKIANFEIIFAYCYAKKIELLNLKIIYVGKLNNIEKSKITKLLRKPYV